MTEPHHDPSTRLTDRSEVAVPSRVSVPAGFLLEVRRQRETVELVPVGEIDISTVGQLQSELDRQIEAGFARIVIDLRQVGFLDSSGVHTLLRAHARAQRDGWQLAIIPGPRAVQRVFEIVGLVDRLPFIAINGGASSISEGSLRSTG